jgi:type I site-specific restriction endonuclease
VLQIAPPSVNGVSNMSNPEATAEAIESVSNLSFEELVAQRTARQNPEPESEEQPEEEVTETEEEEISTEEEEAETEEEPEEEEEESEIDLLSLTTEQIQSLAKKGKSRLLQRIGELTAQKKALEEKIQSQPEIKEVPQEQNPFREIQSFDDLKAKYKELEKTLDSTDELLEEYEDYRAEDIILVGDREFTKQQIRKANRNAREALTKYIPAQQAHLQQIAQMEQLKGQYIAAAEEEVPDIKDESTTVGKQFKDLMSDPLIDKLRKQVPEIGYQIEYILAHAANSINGGTRIKKQPAVANKLKISPSSSPFGAGAAKSSTPSTKKGTDAYSRFEKSGSPEEWVAARIAKYK